MKNKEIKNKAKEAAIKDFLEEKIPNLKNEKSSIEIKKLYDPNYENFIK
jgi:hypothetical protein